MVARVQAHLETIYHLSCSERAERYVVDDETAQQLGSTGRCPEELLVLQVGGDLELALYLDPRLLQRLKQYELTSPETVLRQDLDGYCQVAEGVSHFMYLSLAAASERKVSLLELEAQAEVDKFASCLLQGWGEGALTWARELLHRLFDYVSYRAQLSAPERWRYQEANRISRNYCASLLSLVADRRLDRLLTALRYTYRLGAEAKLRHLALATATPG